MKPARFDYYDPRTLEETVDLLGRFSEDVKVMAGGQSLMPLMNMRLARPAVVVDINKVDAFDFVRSWGSGIAFGATARQRSLERDSLVSERIPILKQAAAHLGHQQIRSRGTICGSLAHADPAAELPALAVALDAEMVASSTSGNRTVPAEELFASYLTTTLEANEVLSEAHFPAPPAGMVWSFLEVSRRHGDFALVGIVAGLLVDAADSIVDVRLAYFGVGPTPIRARQIEKGLIGQVMGDSALAEAAAAASKTVDPDEDIHASVEYRRSVSGVLTRRALSQAWQKQRQSS